MIKNEWEIYKELELIPDNVQPQTSNCKWWLFSLIGRSLANTQVRELPQKYQINHFEHCLIMDGSHPERHISEFALAEPLGKTKRSLIDALIQSPKKAIEET